MTSDISVEMDQPIPQLALDERARNRLVIGLLLASAFVMILNETIMGVALPHLMKDLGISASAAQWLTTAFLLTMAVVIPITGYLLERFHTRPVFIAALSLFSLGTLLGALAPGFPMLVVARVIQACGTAIVMPLLMTTVMRLVPAETRGRTMGSISIVISVAPAIGPTISGIILSALDWRWLFWLVLPIAVLALAAGVWRIRNVSTPRPAPLDILSVGLSALGFGGLVYGLSILGAGGAEGVFSPWLPVIIGTLALAIFVARQIQLQRHDKALLDLRTFLSPSFTIALLVLAISMMALFGSLILLPIYMQNVLGLSVLQTGMMLLPGGLAMGLAAPLVGRLFDRYGPTPLVLPGAIMVSAVMWAMVLLDQTTPAALVLAGHVVLSIGLSLMFTPLFTSALGSLPARLYSHGSATIGTIQQVAGAAGTALFIALMSMQMARLNASGTDMVAATASGIQIAFLCGGIISTLAVIAAVFVRRPRYVEG